MPPIKIELDKESPWENEEWLLLLSYIGARRTHEPTFRKLFDHLLHSEKHLCHQLAKELDMRYDFTPLHSAEGAGSVSQPSTRKNSLQARGRGRPERPFWEFLQEEIREKDDEPTR